MGCPLVLHPMALISKAQEAKTATGLTSWLNPSDWMASHVKGRNASYRDEFIQAGGALQKVLKCSTPHPRHFCLSECPSLQSSVTPRCMWGKAPLQLIPLACSSSLRLLLQSSYTICLYLPSMLCTELAFYKPAESV